MPLLFLFLIAMVVRNVTLPGAMEGVAFYLKPDFSKITAELFVFVLGQVFFALSLGFGVMITLSSYLDKNENLVQTAVITAITNTIIAILAGFMIFPSLKNQNPPYRRDYDCIGCHLHFRQHPVHFELRPLERCFHIWQKYF